MRNMRHVGEGWMENEEMVLGMLQLLQEPCVSCSLIC